MRKLLLSPLLLLLSACSPLMLIDTFTPHDTYRFAASHAYGELERQQLDIYQPLASAAAGKAPVVVFFYGGRWQFGARGEYRFVAEALASRGFVVVVPDYRLYPQVRYPEFLDDSARAVAWVAQHIGDYGGDPANIHLMGHSAGAYNAIMLTVNTSYLQRAGMQRHIRSAIGMAGPYDFLPISDPALQQIFGPASGWPATQPISYASATSPPVLLQTGSDDEVVKPRNSESLAARLREHGVKTELIEYPGLSHAALVGMLAYPLRFRSSNVLADVEQFLRHQTIAPATLHASGTESATETR